MPLPLPARALQAAGAGRFVIANGQLKVDAHARRLLGAQRTSVSLARWAEGLPPGEAQRLNEALAQCSWHAKAGSTAHSEVQAVPLSLQLDLGERTVWWRGQGRDGCIEGVVLPAPAGMAPTNSAAAPMRARDEFVAAISHELRTPLNAILGFGRLARADLPAGADRRHLEHIEQASRLMLRVVNDLLDLTRLEAGKLEIEPNQPLSMAAVVSRVAAVAASLRQDKPVRLYAAVDARCPARLRGDVGRIEQILLNLIANALKFTDRGRIVVDVRLRAHTADSVLLRVSVADTGAGIPPEHLERIVRPFEQAHDPSLPRAVGSGLGLAVVNRLLALHGTALKVSSVAGGGSTFWFDIELPVDASEAEPGLEADTVVLTEDARLAQSVATQWLVHGQALLPEHLADQAGRWVLDAAHPQAAQLAQRARDTGRALHWVSADPVDEAAEVHSLPLLSQAVFRSERDERLAVDPQLLGMRVLVVEDNVLNQHVLREFLRRLGTDVTIVGDAGPVPDLVGQRHFDVLLLDIQLPGMNGWQLAQALRESPNGSRLPIIFLSAHIEASDELGAAALGAMACLSKPFDAAVLQGLLRQLAQQAGVSTRAFQKPATAAAPASPAGRVPLLGLFASQWGGLRQAIEQADSAEALRQALHALRGSLAVLGQADLVSQARRLEEALRHGEHPPPDALAELLAGTSRLLEP